MDALLHHLLRSSAARFPGKEAIVHRNRRMTYAGTWRAVRSLASRLKSAGLERGDRLGVFLDASIPQALSGFRLLTAIEQHRVCRSLYCPIAPLVNYHGVQGGNNLNFSRLPCFRNLHTFINALNAWQPEE